MVRMVLSLVACLFLSTVAVAQMTVSERFSDEMLERLKAGREVHEGDTAGNLKHFVLKGYRKGDTPPELAAWAGDLTFASESWGFLPLKGGVTEQDEVAAISLFESFSRFTEMRDLRGALIFHEIYALDGDGRPKPDPVDGKLEAGTKQFSLVQARSPVLSWSINYKLRFFLEQDTEAIRGGFVNPESVSMGILGQVMPENGFKLHYELYPTADGWVIYARSAVKLSGVAPTFITDPGFVVGYSEAVSAWLQQNL